MDSRQLRKIPWILTIAYGVTMGLLATFNSNALAVAAIVGAAILSLAWVSVNALAPANGGRDRQRRSRIRG
ncbi:MAG: hypothetical protein J2O49_06800 [Sciscionella sp.]|nr:hypothetical protein [Sciscionella sp.]